YLIPLIKLTSLIRISRLVINDNTTMKNTILSRRQTATTVLTSIFTRKLPFLLALAALLALQPNLRAGIQYWDPDGSGAGNDCITGAGLGGLNGNWEDLTTWTPNGNCTGATTTWTEGNDAVFRSEERR